LSLFCLEFGFCLFCFFEVLRIKVIALSMLDKCSTTELHPQDLQLLFLVELVFEPRFPLAKQVLYSLSYISSPFCSGYF
jgi:hypothetical protein